MQLLILVSSLDMGGAQKQAVLDANMLAASQQVYLGMFETGETGEALRKQVDSRVKLVEIPKKGYFSTASRLADFIKKQHIQLVHCHLYAPMLVAALASLRTRVPVLWHFHGHHFEVRRFPLNMLSHLPMVKKLIFVSAMLQQYFQKNYWFPKQKLGVVYNSTQSKKQDNKPEDGIFRIGFVGRLVKLKRVQYLIRLAAFFRDKGFTSFRILIAGDGPERESLEQLTKEEGVEKWVEFLGFRTDLENIYNQLDLFVLPSEEEALSLSLIDASNCALPCIAFDVGGNKEIVQDGETGFIVYTEDELRQKAFQLSQDASLRKELGEKARQHARIFSEENHLKNLLKLYRQFIKDSTQTVSSSYQKGKKEEALS